MVQYAIYNSRLIKKINEEQFIEQHMDQALKNKEFFVMYQPKMSLDNDKIVGAEALVRWNSPELGLLSPDKFIPLFERNGFITTLDFYVYEEVFKFMDSYQIPWTFTFGNHDMRILSQSISYNFDFPKEIVSQIQKNYFDYSVFISNNFQLLHIS